MVKAMRRCGARLAISGDPLPDASRQGLHPLGAEPAAKAEHDTKDAGLGRVCLQDALEHVSLVLDGTLQGGCHKRIGMGRKPLALLRQSPEHAGPQDPLMLCTAVQEQQVASFGHSTLSGSGTGDR